jgi:uncharacterized protein (TIGR00297 family)
LTIDEATKASIVIALAVAMHFSKSLTFSGILASVVVGLLTVFLGGWNCFLVLLAFLVLGIVFTKYRSLEKEPGTLTQEKGGVRTWVNVLANGGPALIPIVLEHFYMMEVLPVFFLSAVCSAASDTLATEIGLLSKSRPRLITNLRKRVEKGVSGGVTPLGTLAGLLGSLSIALVSIAALETGIPGILLNVKDPYRLLFASTAAGFLGMVLDSLLGATVQALYVSRDTGRFYENPRKCAGGCVLIKGFKYFGNNAVNFSSCLIAGALGMAMYMF